MTVKQDGKTIDAVAQATKHGWLYLFDRANGKPLFPIEYRKYPPSTVPGEVAADTQPLPTKPAPFARQLLTADMLSNRTPEIHHWALEQFAKLRSEGQFFPFSLGQETVVFPGFDGGAEWGGSAFDPETGLFYVNANDLAWTSSIVEAAAAAGSGVSSRSSISPTALAATAKIWQGNRRSFLRSWTCAAIVRATGGTTIRQGGGRMAAFPNLVPPKLPRSRNTS